MNNVQQMIDNAIGVGVAFIGCVLYGHIKMAESAQRLDVFDRCCPASAQSWLSPHKYKQVEEPPLALSITLTLTLSLSRTRTRTLTQVEEPVDSADTEMGSCAASSPPAAPESSDTAAPKA